MLSRGTRKIDENDADDEGSLDALTKSDQKGREHGISS